MTRIRISAITACAAAFALSLTSSAIAQPLPGQPDIAGSDEPAPAPDTPDVPGTDAAPGLSDDGTSPIGADENPDDPTVLDEDDGNAAADAKAAAKYPLEIPRRPITLLSGMSEARLDLPVNIDPFAATGTLRVAYGIDDHAELGVRYSIGGVNKDAFFEGKTVSVDFVYTIKEYVAIQVSVPLLLDPVATGLVIGAPLKFRFGPKLAIIGGRDLLSIKLKRFVPEIGNTLADEAAAAADAVGTTMPSGALKLLGGVEYQLKPKLTLTVETGIIAQDFSTNDAGVPLLGSLTYSKSNMFDLGARAGFANLDGGLNSLGIAAFVALRL